MGVDEGCTIIREDKRYRIIEHNSDISGELANQYLEQYGLFLTREVVESISI